MKALQLVLAAALLMGMGAGSYADLFVDASLMGGDYGGGATQDTMNPVHGGSPHVLGIQDSSYGVWFTPTEANNRGNAVIYWQPGTHRNAFRSHGTVSMWITVHRPLIPDEMVSGYLWGENYGWSAFRNGQGTISCPISHVANGAGSEDDRVQIRMSAWHNNVWYYIANTNAFYLEYDRTYHIGFAWGGTNYDYEIWVDGIMMASNDLPAGVNFPWGNSTSGANWGLGSLHERGYSSNSYASAVGVICRDLKIWDEYIALGGTSPGLGPWAQAQYEGNGWHRLPWFGYFTTTWAPWIFHMQHGWMYSVGDAADSLWLYTFDLGWLWTDQALYPWLFYMDGSTWLYYIPGTIGPRWFYNWAAQEWQAI